MSAKQLGTDGVDGAIQCANRAEDATRLSLQFANDGHSLCAQDALDVSGESLVQTVMWLVHHASSVRTGGERPRPRKLSEAATLAVSPRP